MPLTVPFNDDILSRNGLISEVCHLPDDITIKQALLLMSYLAWPMAMAIILNQQCACLYPGYHMPGGTSMMACGNIIKGDQDFGTVKSHGSWYCGIAEKARYSLWLFPIVCPLSLLVAAKNLKRWVERISTKCKLATAPLIRFCEKQFNKAMVIFSTNKKNIEKIWKKIVCKKMKMEKKCLQKIIFSSPPPPPTLQKNNGPSLMGTSYLDVL